MPNPLETYLKEIRDIRATGAAVAETSFYPALANLLNAVGGDLKPKVRCVVNIADRGAGLPDGGLFTADQFRKGGPDPLQGQKPARGAVEVKSPTHDIRALARSEQAQRYLNEYGVLLATNYRQFLLLGFDNAGNPLPMESYSLAADEASFWEAAAHPRKTAALHAGPFLEYLARAMQSTAPLASPQDVAWFLASYARDAKARVEARKDLSALASVRNALEEALGMKFEGERGDHFFRSTLVQTLFYGVFSAWALWHRENPEREDAFEWRLAQWSLRVPFIRALYEHVATATQLGGLGLVEVLDWTAAALNRIDRAAFFRRFQEEHAVQYFYEPFLKAFDPELRKELGVWYTPPEIVQYQVARVDAALREELNLPDGLADPNVVVLDPCCGTGAYLVEVLKKIAETKRAKGEGASVPSTVKEAATSRVFGFEILPSPFVVAHLQMGLMLHELGAPLDEGGKERVGVYLTNALTGWEAPKEPKQSVLAFISELKKEKDAAEKVKQKERVLVVLGNPPYNAFAGVSPEEEQGLVEPYKVGLNAPVSDGGWGIKKFNLDDLYIRFFRLAERRIAEMTGRGVVSFISNFSWIAEPSFVVMRQRLLESFDRFWIENLHGNARQGERAPDGQPSGSIFAIEGFSVGIKTGVATSLWIKTGEPRKAGALATVLHRDDIEAANAEERRKQLLDSLRAKRFKAAYVRATPRKENRCSFRPEEVSEEYHAWPKVADWCAITPFNGPVERRGNSLIAMPADASNLLHLETYLDPATSDEAARLAQPAFMKSSGEFAAEEARNSLKGKVAFDAACIHRYPFKPFDVRLAYLDANIAPLFSRPSPNLLLQRFPGNKFFITRDTADKHPEGSPFFFSSLICDYDSISGHARHFPVRLVNGVRLKKSQSSTLFDVLGTLPEMEEPVANLSKTAREYLALLKVPDPDSDADAAELIWLHALAIGYSPAYLSENADGIRRDWPRIPLPAKREDLESSAALGRQVAALLDTEADVPGVTAGDVGPFLRTVAVPAKAGGGAWNPVAGDLALNAGWGHGGKGGAVMPGRGRAVQRPYEESEREALRRAAEAMGMEEEQALALLGQDTLDIYLNERAYWKNVPANVWNFFIGGYQVFKKWLSYREEKVLGRPLRPEEAREAANMARRLAQLVLMQPALDANYRKAKADAYPWPKQPSRVGSQPTR